MQIFIEKMSLNEKFLMLEELWSSMSKDAKDSGFTPNWHLSVLEDREKLAKESDAFSSLSSAQERLENLLNEY